MYVKQPCTYAKIQKDITNNRHIKIMYIHLDVYTHTTLIY